MQSWQLPEHIADILPDNARHLESAKEQLLALFRVHGYELVYPPLMEYSDSLLTHIDAGLALKTIRVVDQLSGRQLGIRADITPQVARIDAHLLSANQGINRLCYAAPVLHARPDGLLNTREPFQSGAELYGCERVSADIEIIGLMLQALRISSIGKLILSLGHIGIFRALSDSAKLNPEQSTQLLAQLQNKDRAGISRLCREWGLDDIWHQALIALPTLYGGRDTLEKARQTLPRLSAINQALEQLQNICDAFAHEEIHIDLSEIRVDSYHTGLLYGAYSPKHHDAVARGGRYDGLGAYFGRARPATGFSFDLRFFNGYLPETQAPTAVSVAESDLPAAAEAVAQLRAQGTVVVVDYGLPDNSRSTQKLTQRNGEWIVV